jgi:hypothetical protein
MDGLRQRQVVSALERALDAMERGDVASVAREAATISRLNQREDLRELPTVLVALAEALAAGDEEEGRRQLRLLGELLGPSPLSARAAHVVATAWETR